MENNINEEIRLGLKMDKLKGAKVSTEGAKLSAGHLREILNKLVVDRERR